MRGKFWVSFYFEKFLHYSIRQPLKCLYLAVSEAREIILQFLCFRNLVITKIKPVKIKPVKKTSVSDHIHMQFLHLINLERWPQLVEFVCYMFCLWFIYLLSIIVSEAMVRKQYFLYSNGSHIGIIYMLSDQLHPHLFFFYFQLYYDIQIKYTITFSVLKCRYIFTCVFLNILNIDRIKLKWPIVILSNY